MAGVSGGPVSAAVAVAPLPGATNVSRSGPIDAWFDRSMDSASCASRFTLHMGDSSGVAVRGHMQWDPDHRHMTFHPDSLMAPDTQYWAVMGDSMMTQGTMMTGGMMGTGGMGSTNGGQHSMPGSPMLFDRPPAGAERTRDGVMWSFATGPR